MNGSFARTLLMILGALTLGTASGVQGAESQVGQTPNIVVFLIDDLGWGDVGFHNPSRKTPHIDGLAMAGLRLEQHYVATMCSPTRAALMTGRYWSRFAVTSATNDRVLRYDTVTLPRALKKVGYDTALVGKWHLGSKPEQGPQRFGFDHSYGSLAGGVGPYDHRYKTGPFSTTWHRNGALIQEEGHVTDLITGEAVRWIESRGQRPFFLYVPYTAVHIPVIEQQRWLDLYPDEPEPSRRHWAACLSHVDDGIGQIVAALKRTGRFDNTLLLFSGDNGAPPNARNDDPQYPNSAQYPAGPAGGSNAPLHGQKSQVYEGGIRVPAFVHWPQRLKPGQYNHPVHIVDWMPTLSRLVGFQAKSELKWDGQDVWPTLIGERPFESRVLYWAGSGFRSSAIRQSDWKLIVEHAGNRAELYNLANDPNEQRDLASEQSEQVDRLRRLLEQVSAADRDAVANDPE